ncbi:MAG: N-succinylarginine dihydrolase [Phycisphaerales bacterium]|nr:N-succinylarginine dihydrolase [Phycisphaerales bacterium]
MPMNDTTPRGFQEVNFDGLIGPTHNYAGLSAGNIASLSNAGGISKPKAAALQGLSKMKALMDLGLTQGVLPPQQRPDLAFLRAIGFEGPDAHLLAQANDADPTLLAAVWSASSMWAANAATVSPSPDTADHKVHLTPANLVSNLHRSIEHPTTTRALRMIFKNPDHFTVHDPLPTQARFADEGAANHVRFANTHGEPGIELFVYGVDVHDPSNSARTYPSRQTRAACEAIVRNHKLNASRVVFARQHPDAIDAGVFHNDVIATGNERVFLYHEQAFATSRSMLTDLAAPLGQPLIPIEAHDTDFSLEDAVKSYLFNSQIVTLPDQSMALIAPLESSENPRVSKFIDAMVADTANPVNAVHYLDVRESMRNGGGPACLRLRVPLSDTELGAVHQGVILTDELHAKLVDFVSRSYPDELNQSDLLDPALAQSCIEILDELTQILDLPALYPFQH